MMDHFAAAYRLALNPIVSIEPPGPATNVAARSG